MRLHILYSDQGYFHGVYSTPELAAEEAKRCGLDYDGDTVEVDELTELVDGQYGWCMEFWPDGSVQRIYNFDAENARSWGAPNCGVDRQGCAWATVLAKTEDEAITAGRAVLAERKPQPADVGHSYGTTFTITREDLLSDGLTAIGNKQGN